MARIVEIREPVSLSTYEAYVHLAPVVERLRVEAREVVPRLAGRRVWMINSTASGGGVAEMLPKMVALLRELGVDTEWIVIESSRNEFFPLTKKLHNLIHAVGDPDLNNDDRKLYEEVSRENAEAIEKLIGPEDVIVVHDPQPAGAGAMILRERHHPSVWRCHIGADETNASTTAAWDFLGEWLAPYDRAVFSATEYVPKFLARKSTLIYPGIDPLSHKNRDLTPHKLQGILCNSGLAVEHAPVLTPSFDHVAHRLQPDGDWLPANTTGEIGLLYRPIVAQISRWDRLKGFLPLLDAFTRLKLRQHESDSSALHRRRLQILRLVLAGPDPSSVADDPEATEVLDEIVARYCSLAPDIQRDVAILSLPMASRKENALMVNAIQRCATVVAQNSIREGFGLTVAEAMWKRAPIVGSKACGIRQQVRDGVDGVLVNDPEDIDEVALAIDRILRDPERREHYASNSQLRVHEHFLIFTQLRRWLRVLEDVAQSPARLPIAKASGGR